MRRSRSSGTLGRPSGERSPFHWGLIATRSAFEAAIPLGRSWAVAAGADASPASQAANAALLVSGAGGKIIVSGSRAILGREVRAMEIAFGGGPLFGMSRGPVSREDRRGAGAVEGQGATRWRGTLTPALSQGRGGP